MIDISKKFYILGTSGEIGKQGNNKSLDVLFLYNFTVEFSLCSTCQTLKQVQYLVKFFM